MIHLSVDGAGDAARELGGRHALEDFLRIREERTDHPPLADPKLATLHGRGDGFVVSARPDPGGPLVGLAVGVPVQAGGDVWNLGDTSEDAVTREALVRRAIEETRDRGATRVQWWAFKADDADDRTAATLGLAPWREVVELRRPLPHPDAAGAAASELTLRSFVPGADDEALLEVNRRAFAEHPEQGAFRADDLASRMAESWFNPDDVLLAVDDKGILGFCWVKIPLTPDGPPTHGEIYVIGVDPRAQGRGLGRLLVLAGLSRMDDRGAPQAHLYTDASNRAALRLYDALAFVRDHVDRAYCAELGQ